LYLSFTIMYLPLITGSLFFSLSFCAVSASISLPSTLALPNRPFAAVGRGCTQQMGSHEFLQMYVSAETIPTMADRWKQLGICFQSNYTILHLDIADNPSKPCLSCTKQWCLNQNLPICAGAKLGDTNPDTATGKEGDVEARCFRKSCRCPTIPAMRGYAQFLYH
jgi:hypothetical protein